MFFEPLGAFFESAEGVEVKSGSALDGLDLLFGLVGEEESGKVEALFAEDILGGGDATGFGVFEEGLEVGGAGDTGADRSGDVFLAEAGDVVGDFLGGEAPLGDNLHLASGVLEKLVFSQEALPRFGVFWVSFRVASDCNGLDGAIGKGLGVEKVEGLVEGASGLSKSASEEKCFGDFELGESGEEFIEFLGGVEAAGGDVGDGGEAGVGDGLNGAEVFFRRGAGDEGHEYFVDKSMEEFDAIRVGGHDFEGPVDGAVHGGFGFLRLWFHEPHNRSKETPLLR